MVDSEIGHGLIVLNRKLALERVGGDLDLLREVARLILDSQGESLAEIERAIESNNARDLEHAAHTLKGSVASVGAEQVAEVARALEMMGRRSHMGDAAAGLAALKSALLQLEPELKTLAGS